MEEGILPLRKRVEEAFIASSTNGLGGGGGDRGNGYSVFAKPSLFHFGGCEQQVRFYVFFN